MKTRVIQGLTLALVLAAGHALAMAPPPPPGALIVPAKLSASALELLDGSMALECSRVRELQCSFAGSYRLRNPGDEELQQELAIGVSGEQFEILLDGQPLTTRTTEQAKLAVGGRRVTSFAVTLTVAAHATRVLQVRGDVVVSNQNFFPFIIFPANSARHVLLANHQPDESYSLRFGLNTLSTWSGAPKMELSVKVPDSLDLHGPLDRAADGSYRATATKAADVHVEVEKSAPIVYRGGVLAGIGGSTGDAKGLRLRVAGELAFASWLLGSLAYETNARTAHYFVPAVHAATPMLAIVPSVGAGLGVPIRVAPETRVGLRLQLDLHLALLGFLTTIDWYPQTSNEPSLVQPSFLFQVGL